MTTAQDQQSRELWIDPNNKSRAQYLPHIGEAVLFKHAGRVYTGKHTGGSFKADYPLGKSFTTWDCVWMYPAALDAAAQVQAMGRVPPGWQAVPVEPTGDMLVAIMSPGEVDVLRETPERHQVLLIDIAGVPDRYASMLAAAPRSPAAQEGA